MDLIEKILDFLKEQHLDSTVAQIQTELATSKKPETDYILQSLNQHFSPQSLAPNLQTMQKFITKLSKHPQNPKKKPKFLKKPAFLQTPQASATTNPSSFFTPSPNHSQTLFQPTQSIPFTSNPSTNLILSSYEASLSQLDQYENDEDLGFTIIECKSHELSEKIPEVLEKYTNLPKSSVNKPQLIPVIHESWVSDKDSGLLPDHAKFPLSADEYYPKEHESVTYDCFSVKIIYDRDKTGFESSNEFEVEENQVIAGRFRVVQMVGKGNFSQVVHCVDEVTQEKVCLKIVENFKETLDKSLDEIKILRYLKANCDPEQKNILDYKDCFYHKEHLFIVTELLRDNLQVFLSQKRNTHLQSYFTLGRIQRFSHQILTALDFIHSLNVIHADLKPENILIKSYSACLFKIIDFGSASFAHDTLSSYAQSRNYRAPEVILGFHYDFKIDIWSLGCILFEIFTGKVLFDTNTVQEFLTKVIGLCGQFSEDFYKFGRYTKKYFTKERIIFAEVFDNYEGKKENKKVKLFVPKMSCLKNRMKCEDLVFVDFVRNLILADKGKRPTAQQALQHPFLTEARYLDGLFKS